VLGCVARFAHQIDTQFKGRECGDSGGA
jgi:hypothetical protein